MDAVGLQADLTDATAVTDEVVRLQPSKVLHLAGMSFVGHGDARAFYDVNLFGTLNLLDALAACPVPAGKILLASSANVYGNAPASPIAEGEAPAPANHYAMSKLAMELMARNFAERLPLVITRPFNYTGPGQSPDFVIPKLVAHFAQRRPLVELGNLNVEREFNDVRFVCNAYLKLLEQGVSGQIYNVCSGRPSTLQHVIDLLAQLSGHTLDVKVNPTFVRRNEVHRLCGDPARLLATVGPLAMPGLEDTLSWMLAEARGAGMTASR